ncbi:MAG: WD40 repeat domain-containing protein [Treponema sp.]|nr:WD40 repeat domain-containing protein [Treponema sp.]
MAKGNRKWWYIAGFGFLVFYIFIAARSIPEETVLVPRWINSLESNFPINLGGFSSGDSKELIPFRLGDRFGYVGDNGKFAINQIQKGYVSISENYWAEYDALPPSIQVMNSENKNVMTIENTRGYPVFLNDRIFIVGNEQNSLTAIGTNGEELWTYDFPAPITCIDGTGPYVLAGTLDGAVELLDGSGKPIFTPFEPGGSRLSVILGCAISRDASRLAIISGIDNQRFLLLEHTGNEPSQPHPGGQIAIAPGDSYKVIYHEFLSGAFRRPVHISFVDNDSKVAFERVGGLGIYDIGSRTSISVPVKGEISVLDNSGGDKYLFVITSLGQKERRFVVIRYPAYIMIDVPYKSDNAFFARRGEEIYFGGDRTMASMKLDKK